MVEDARGRQAAIAQPGVDGHERRHRSPGQAGGGVVAQGQPLGFGGGRRADEALHRRGLVHEDVARPVDGVQPLVAAGGGVAGQKLAPRGAESGPAQEVGLERVAI